MGWGADNGYFTDDSMLRRLHLEKAVMMMGPRSVLLQAAHPQVVTALWAHGSSVDDPYNRLIRTTDVMAAIGFGSREDADRETAGVRKIHDHVNGKVGKAIGPYPKGMPYSANDPDLLLWVLFTLLDSAVVAYRTCVAPLSRADEAAYWEDMKVVGSLFGLREGDMPPTLDDLDAYRREMYDSDRLQLSDWARGRAIKIIFKPPVPWYTRPAVAMMNSLTIAMLPERVRELYGFRGQRARRAAWAAGTGVYRRVVVPLLPEKVRWAPPSSEAMALLSSPSEA